MKKQLTAQISGRLDDLKKTAFEAQAVEQIEVKEKGFLTKTVQMSRENFEQLQSLAKAGEVFRKENKKLEKELADERSKTSELTKKNRSLEAKNVELGLENRFLKRSINKFMDAFKEKKQEYMIMFGHLKAMVLRQMNMKITDNYFENQNEIKGAKHFCMRKSAKRLHLRKIEIKIMRWNDRS
ncbi:hypothetical protein ACEQPO_31420 [Bacillus sp. SL00103]